MIEERKIKEMIQRWKARRATTEQKAVIRDLEALLKGASDAETEIFTGVVEL